MNFDAIVREWFYRLPKGYADAPYTEAELTVLNEVLSENGITLSEVDQLDQAFNDAEPVKEEIDTTLPIEEKISQIEQVLIDEVKLESALVNKVLDIYSKFSPSEQKEFDENFRTMTIEEFVNSDKSKIFQNFHEVKFDEKVAGGLGRGEVQILLAVAGSETGGTGKHDIVMQNGEWEVKELDKDAFRPAKAGRAFNFPLTGDIIDFYDDIVKPYISMSDPAGSLKEMVAEKSYKSIDELVDIMEKRFAPGGDYDENKIQSAYEWPGVDYWNNWYEGFKELNSIMNNIKDDIKDTRIAIQSGGQEKAYWISPEDASQIEAGSGKDDQVVINVGTEINEISSNRKIWFNRVKRFDFVRNPKLMIESLKDIRNSFFEGVIGLIYFKKGEKGKPYIGTNGDFVVYAVSQGQYRYRLKTHNSVAKYPYTKEQVGE